MKLCKCGCGQEVTTTTVPKGRNLPVFIKGHHFVGNPYVKGKRKLFDINRDSKVCSLCGTDQPLTEFYKFSRSYDGLKSYCKSCAKLMGKQERLAKFGLTPSQFQEMIKNQRNQCAICSSIFTLKKARLPQVDHDHETGQVRALLCSSCNLGLGHFKDNIQIFKKSIQYIKNTYTDLTLQLRAIPIPEFKGNNSLYKKSWALTRKYGINVDAYLWMLLDQNYQCKICSTSLDSLAHVDHNHQTDEIRGLLCNPCNSGLPKFHEDPKLLQQAINYLQART